MKVTEPAVSRLVRPDALTPRDPIVCRLPEFGLSGEPLTPPLKHPASLSFGGFLAEGKYLFTQDAAGVMTLWDLPRDPRPVEDWVALASLLAAHRLTPAGLLEPLSEEALTNSWRTLRAKYPDDFRPSRGFKSLTGPRP